MATVSILPNSASVDAAWERYRQLAAAAMEDRALMLNRDHQQAMARAYHAWTDAYMQLEARDDAA